MKALCVAALAALMAWAPTLAGPASAEDDLGFESQPIRFAVFAGGPVHETCALDISGDEPLSIGCCPTWTSAIILKLTIRAIDDAGVHGRSAVACVARDDVSNVADADS